MQLKNLEINSRYFATGCKILSILIIPAFITTAKAQVAAPAPYSTNTLINNIRSWDASKPDTNSLNFGSSTSILVAKMTNQYLDGFGRQVQTVIRRGSLATGTPSVDLVSAATYDGFGREPLNYLPFASGNTGGIVPTSDGSFKINSFQQDSVFTTAAYGESWYYGQTKFRIVCIRQEYRKLCSGK